MRFVCKQDKEMYSCHGCNVSEARTIYMLSCHEQFEQNEVLRLKGGRLHRVYDSENEHTLEPKRSSAQACER